MSGLVLNFVPDVPAALDEAARVARPGGTVAAYVWDYAGRMELLRRFWDAAVELDPAAAELDEGGASRSPRPRRWRRRGSTPGSPRSSSRRSTSRPGSRTSTTCGCRSRCRSGPRPATSRPCRPTGGRRSGSGCGPRCPPGPRARSTSSPGPGRSAAGRPPGTPDVVPAGLRVPGAATPRAAGPPLATLGPWTSPSRPPRPTSGDAPARYVVDALQPLEAEFERNHGAARRHDPRAQAAGDRGAASTAAASRRRAGGQGWTALEQVLVHEQLGQATGGLWSFIPGALQRARPLHAGAAPPVPRPEPARRAQRQLRDHRAGPGLRRADARLDRGPRPRRPGSGSSTARSGSSPARRTPTS